MNAHKLKLSSKFKVVLPYKQSLFVPVTNFILSSLKILSYKILKVT